MTSLTGWLILAIPLLVIIVLAALLLLFRGGRFVQYIPMADSSPPRRDTFFKAVWPRIVPPQEWQPFLVYVFAGFEGSEGAATDIKRRTAGPIDHYASSTLTGAEPERGVEIMVVPDIPGVEFNPPNARIRWLEDWHVLEFRTRLLADGATAGPVNFFVGPILVGNIEVKIQSPSEAVRPVVSTSHATSSGYSEQPSSPYRSIFVSYSHQDAEIVSALERAYIAIGDSYLRDIHVLRSGELWNISIFQLIDWAQVFQLCWSAAAKASPYVEQEWRHAVDLRRPRFIRPIYWAKPLPEPPPELHELHFAFVPLSGEQ